MAVKNEELKDRSFESLGGYSHALYEPGLDGYDQTVCSVELEKGKIPFVIELTRPLNKNELENLIRCVADVYQS